jgi:branched-chain amino acid transport system substrate-binding protein
MGKATVKMCMVMTILITVLALAPISSLARPIKIGIVDTYSGPAAVFCNDCLNGFKLALDDINKRGVLGTKIEFVTRDDKFKVDLGLSMAKELVMKEKVDVLVGTMSSGVAMALSDYARTQKVPFIVWLSKSDRITGEKGHRYAFMTSENTAMVGKAAAMEFARKPFKKFWIAGDDYEFGHAIANSTWGYLKKLKPEAELIGESWWKVGEPDLIPYITNILAAKPDVLIACTGGASMHNIMKVAKATEMTKKVQIWVHGATDYLVIKPLGREAPEGVMSSNAYQFYYPDVPSNKAFVKKFQEAYGSPPSFMAFHGYNTARFIAEAYKKAGAIDKEKFINALEGLKIDSPAGKIEMRACDHQVALPIYFGLSKLVPEYDFAIVTDVTTMAGKDVMPTCEEIMETRRK